MNIVLYGLIVIVGLGFSVKERKHTQETRQAQYTMTRALDEYRLGIGIDHAIVHKHRSIGIKRPAWSYRTNKQIHFLP